MANDTAESLLQTILAAVRAVTLEMKLSLQDWKEIASCIMFMINSAALERLGKNDDGSLRTPLQVMNGICRGRPIARIIPQGGSKADAICLEKARAQQLLIINAIRQQLDTLHKEAFDTISKRRKQAIAAHYANINLLEPNFQIGDILLVRRTIDKRYKLRFLWRGPLRVILVH